jgi:hypothetical protein
MAELNVTDRNDEACCAPEHQATCCEPGAKADWCGHEEGCGCDKAISTTIRAEKQDA